MAKEDKLPPAGKGSRKGPEMIEEDPSITNKLSQLAAREQGGMGGMEGGDTEQQSAQLLMAGAQQLMQAAQMNPALQPIVEEALRALQAGVQRMTGGGGMGEESMGEEYQPKRRPRRQRPPKREEFDVEEQPYYG